MPSETQLAFDGREVSIPASMASWHPTAAQRLVLSLARRPEGVTTLQAGVALHTRRKSLGTGGCWSGPRPYVSKRGKGCCRLAASDGYACLKRLWARGVVEQRTYRGPYFAVNND